MCTWSQDKVRGEADITFINSTKQNQKYLNHIISRALREATSSGVLFVQNLYILQMIIRAQVKNRK